MNVNKPQLCGGKKHSQKNTHQNVDRTVSCWWTRAHFPPYSLIQQIFMDHLFEALGAQQLLLLPNVFNEDVLLFNGKTVIFFFFKPGYMFHPSGWHENKDNLFHPQGELVGDTGPLLAEVGLTPTYLESNYPLPQAPPTKAISTSSNVRVKHPQVDIYFSPGRPEPQQARSAEDEKKVLETKHHPECILHV